MSAPKHHESFDVAQERDAIAAWRVGLVILAGVLVTLVSVAIAGWLLSVTRRALPWHPVPVSAVAPRTIAGIHQTPIEHDSFERARRERQRETLDRYRWLDPAHTTAQIPIDRAMQIVIDDLATSSGQP